MEKEFVQYELALRMKALGFDEPCFNLYSFKTKEFMYAILHVGEVGTYKYANHNKTNHISAPTFSQAFRWFREKYSWQHSIDPTSDQHSFELGYNYWIWNNKTGEEYHTMPKNRPTGDWGYETYEEAELACLEKLIGILESK